MPADIASTTPEGLLQAFAQTDYRVRLDADDVVVRVGCGHDRLDRSLDGRDWTIITAFNPGARPGDDGDNRRRHERLCDDARQSGFETRPSVNRDPSGRWPDEPGLLIVGLNADARAQLARRFDQAAVLIGRGGDIARLELHGPGWPESLPRWALRAD
jgi:hypothetical protein